MEQILYPFKNALWALRPCKAFGRSISASLPNPQTPFPGKGAILLGLPPLDPVGGYAPKQGCFGCLPKVLHDAKPAEQAILDIPFLSTIEVFRQSETAAVRAAAVDIFACRYQIISLISIFSPVRPT